MGAHVPNWPLLVDLKEHDRMCRLISTVIVTHPHPFLRGDAIEHLIWHHTNVRPTTTDLQSFLADCATADFSVASLKYNTHVSEQKCDIITCTESNNRHKPLSSKRCLRRACQRRLWAPLWIAARTLGERCTLCSSPVILAYSDMFQALKQREISYSFAYGPELDCRSNMNPS